MKTDLILQRSTFFSINSSSTILKRLSTGSISLVRKTIFLVCVGFFGFNSWGQIAQTVILNPGITSWQSPVGATEITVKCWGGGGGGGRSTTSGQGGSGGGSGGYTTRTITLTGQTTFNVTVGVKGSRGQSSGSATNGGNTSFGSGSINLLANGGTGGANNAGTKGIGGSASGGSTNTLGADGGQGGSSSGAGGSAPGAGGAGGASVTNNNGINGTAPGGGGSGGEKDGNNRNGGDGGDGRIEISYTLPESSFTSFRSIAAASWSATSTWQMSADGTNWVTATFVPNSSTLNISILNDVTITDLTIPTTQTVTIGDAQLTVSGNLINNGIIASSDGNSKLEVQGNFSNSGTIGVANDLILRGNFTNTNSSLSLICKVLLEGNANQNISGFTTNDDVEMLKTGGTATLIGNVIVGGDFLMEANGGTLNLGAGLTHTFSNKVEFDRGTLNGGSSTLNANGSGQEAWFRSNNNTTSFVRGTSTIIFGHFGDQTIDNEANITTFNNVTFAGSGVKTIPAEITINGNLTLTGTASTALAANETIGGNVTIGSGTTLSCESNNRVLTLNGNFENNGTFIAGTGAHTFTGSGKTISGTTNPTTIPRLAITGTYTNSAALTVSTALSGAGSLTNTGTFNASGAGIGSISITTLSNSGTLNRSGNGTTTTVLANFTNTGTINISGSGEIAGITNNAGGTVNHSGSSTVTSFNNATATSVLNISSTPSVPTFTTLTTTAAGNTVNYTGAGPQTVKANVYSNLTLSGSGAKTLLTATTINGNLSISGSATTSLVENETIGGNVTIGTGTTLARSTFSLTTLGNFVNNGTFSGSGAVNFTGGAATQTISGTGALNFSNLTVSKTAGVVSLENNITISGALNFEVFNFGIMNLNGKTLTYSGTDIQRNGGGLIGSTNSSKLIISKSNQIPSSLFQSEIYDLEISGLNTIVSSADNYTILNNLTVGNGATFNKEDGSTLIFKGNIVNNGTITNGTSGDLGSFTFNNTNEQTISGQPLSVTNLEVSKTLGKLIVSVPITITGKFDVNGIIDNSTNLITLGSSAGPGTLVHTGGRITGALRRYFANSTGTDYYFPIGNTTSTRGVTINMSQLPGSNEYITAQYKAGTPVSVSGATLYDGLPLTTADGQLIQNFDEEGYWQIDPKQYDAGIDTKNYTISLQMNNISGVNDYTKTRIIKADGPSHVAWSALTHVSATGSNTNFTLTASGNGFSWFNGGGDNNNNPLPVELISFNGTCNEGMINLLWQTASEFNSSHFDVEKSTDGETWRVLATIPSAGTSNELLTYQALDNNGTNGANYYRLRQVDIDGKEKLYDPINVSCVETTAGYFTSYPNPSGNEFQVVVNNKEILGACTLNIVDVHGKVIDQRSIDMKDGINMFVINETLNPGIYFLNITNGIKSTQVIKHAVK
jgi:hypothetical protein